MIAKEDEDFLWKTGVLRIQSAEPLLNVVFYMNGKNFHLRGGAEHRNLRISQPQRYSNPDKYVYIENGSKNRSGGIRDFQNESKVVPVYSNPAAKERCHVYLLDLYLSKLHSVVRQSDTFYVRPAKTSDEGGVWFTNLPVGRNTLSKITKTMFLKAGITDKNVSNHSLRVTGTSELFYSGVPKKIIQQRTGHKSLDALRCYERTTSSQE